MSYADTASGRLPEELDTFFEKAAVALILVNKKGRILEVNRKGLEMLGKSKSEVINLLGGEAFECINASVDGKLVGGTSNYCSECVIGNSLSSTLRTKEEIYQREGHLDIVSNGVTYHLSLMVSTGLITVNNEECVLLTINDITNRKKLEKELKKSEERLKKAQGIGQIGHWELDIVHNKLTWSDEIYRIFDVEPQSFEATYEAFLANVHPEDRELVDTSYKKSLIEKKSYEIEHRLLLKSGMIKYVLEKCHTEYDEAGKPLLSIGTVNDITELKEKEMLLEEAIATKNKFFSIIAHDLKSPFNGLLGLLDLLLGHHSSYDNEEREEIISAIHKSAHGVYDLLENLLTWSLSQSDKIKLLKENICLNSILLDVVDILHKHADEKNIQIAHNISENYLILADVNMVTSILRNLISNAIKFTERGGSISITAEEQNDFIKISVRDTGIGISAERMGNLFKIGTNTSILGTQNEKGTGLGLVLCNDFVQQHGGKIWVESQLGEGSTFCFTLPLVQSSIQ
ncbi:PAS domain S-box protein [Puteibacter caeruleilacunae]|nr:PAS domain S-box protein [Puteibacter caeruleilacunae]